jgi:hypothetical protein
MTARIGRRQDRARPARGLRAAQGLYAGGGGAAARAGVSTQHYRILCSLHVEGMTFCGSVATHRAGEPLSGTRRSLAGHLPVPQPLPTIPASPPLWAAFGRGRTGGSGPGCTKRPQGLARVSLVRYQRREDAVCSEEPVIQVRQSTPAAPRLPAGVSRAQTSILTRGSLCPD